MFMVYWSVVEPSAVVPHSKTFESHEMVEAMRLMESLRIPENHPYPIRFVVMSSENPNSVGKPGVAEVGPDYNWKKRR